MGHAQAGVLLLVYWLESFEQDGTLGCGTSFFPLDEIARKGLLIDLRGASSLPSSISAPKLPKFLIVDYSRSDMGTRDLRKDFFFDLWFQLPTIGPQQVLLDNRTPNGQGFTLQTTDRGTLEMVLNDGRSESRWDCDPDLLKPGTLHHVVVVVDGGPKIITFIVDGGLCDGGEHRQFGWGRFNPNLRDVNGADDQVLACLASLAAPRTFETLN